MMFFALCISLIVQTQLCAMEEVPQDTIPLSSATMRYEDVTQALVQGVTNESARYVILSAYIPSEHLTQTFIDAVNQLSQDIVADDRWLIINSLTSAVSANHLTQIFIDAVNQLSQGMDGYKKSTVILAVNKVFLANRQMPPFMAIVNQLSQCIEEQGKYAFIDYFSRISNADWLTLITNTSTLERIFTPDRTAEFNSFVPYSETRSFIDKLLSIPPERWEPEAIRMINLYRHDTYRACMAAGYN